MGLLKYAALLALVVFVVYLELSQSSMALPPEDGPRAPPPTPGVLVRKEMPNIPLKTAEKKNRPRLVNQTWTTNGPRIPVLGVSVFVNAELLVRLLNSIDYHVEHVVIIQNGKHPGVAVVLDQLREEQPDWIIQAYPDNVGCAGAWNKVIEAVPGADYYIISNDDIGFYPGALRQFALGVEQHREMVRTGKSNKVILYPSHGDLMWRSPPWSCFAILKHVIDLVGTFDTNFWPVYHEDYDYMCRMARVGLWQTLIPEARVQHGWRSDKYEAGMDRASKDQGKVAVLDEYKQQQERHERGSPYYALKWGIGETPGIYDAGNGYWNKTCTPAGCKAEIPVLYEHPFNDSSLPLSFVRHDAELRRCLQYGTKKKCRYDWRLLPHPELVPHDMYMPAARTWIRKVVRVNPNGDWLTERDIKALPESDMHSVCYMKDCDPLGPDASIDDDFGSFFAFNGNTGFVTYELAGCMRIIGMLYHGSQPCDAGDAKEFMVQSSMAKAGPWTDVLHWPAGCQADWVESPAFEAEGIYLRLKVLANNGYQMGTRIAEVSFLKSKKPCSA